MNLKLNDKLVAEWKDQINKTDKRGFALDHLMDTIGCAEKYLEKFERDRPEFDEIFQKKSHKERYPARHAKLLVFHEDAARIQKKFLTELVGCMVDFIKDEDGIELVGVESVIIIED